jgi:hypothetical protein
MSFELLDQLFHHGHLSGEGSFATLGDLGPGSWPTAFVAFGNGDQSFVGQYFQVTAKIPVGELKKRLQVREICSPAL